MIDIRERHKNCTTVRQNCTSLKNVLRLLSRKRQQGRQRNNTKKIWMGREKVTLMKVSWYIKCQAYTTINKSMKGLQKQVHMKHQNCTKKEKRARDLSIRKAKIIL